MSAWKVRITVTDTETNEFTLWYIVDRHNVEAYWDDGKTFYSKRYAMQVLQELKQEAYGNGLFEITDYELIEVR